MARGLSKEVEISYHAGVKFFYALLLIGWLPLHAQITGQVTLLGTPKSPDTEFYAKAYGCGESPNRKTENWKIGPKGELAEVVVWVVDPKSVPITANPIPTRQINQIGCRYEPHVQVTNPSMGIDFLNSDPAPHNVHCREAVAVDQPLGADVFNVGEARQGMESLQTFPHPGLYNISCEVHYWMQAWVYVVPESTSSFFGLSNQAGQFAIPGQLLDGTYKIRAWHPRFKEPLEQTLVVKNGKGTANFQFDASKGF